LRPKCASGPLSGAGFRAIQATFRAFGGRTEFAARGPPRGPVGAPGEPRAAGQQGHGGGPGAAPGACAPAPAAAPQWQCPGSSGSSSRAHAFMKAMDTTNSHSPRGGCRKARQARPTGLFWNEDGRVACARHAPYRDSDTWRRERWVAVTPATAAALTHAMCRPACCDDCGVEAAS